MRIFAASNVQKMTEHILSLLYSLPMLTCAFLTAELLLAYYRDKQRPQAWLTLWACTATLLYMCHYLYFHHSYALLPLIDPLYTACNLAVFPFYLIYISQTTEPRPLSTRPQRMLLLSLPMLIGGAGTGLLYSLMNREETMQFLNTYLYEGSHAGLTGKAMTQALMHDAARTMFALLVIITAVAGIRMIRRYHQEVAQFYADTDERRLHGVTSVLILLPLTAVASSVANIVGRNQFEDSWLIALPSVGFSILLFFIGRAGLRQTFTIETLKQEMQLTEENARQKAQTSPPISESLSTSTSGPQTTNMLNELERLMKEERLFLTHDLRLQQVSKKLGTNRTYLLRMLNEELHMNFSEYINRQRVAYAEELQERMPHLQKAEIALKSGYNSYHSYYRNWKMYRRNK